MEKTISLHFIIIKWFVEVIEMENKYNKTSITWSIFKNSKFNFLVLPFCSWNIILLTFSFKGALAEGSNVLVVGAGPCGLRTAIETQMLGATTVIIERRDGFTRNNVLKLWKFLMEDIKSLGGKKLFGMFCAGNINHVGIKTLQLILSKVAMLLGKQSWSQ